MPVAAHLSLEQRVALGKEARKRAPRSGYAALAEAAETGRIAVEAGL